MAGAPATFGVCLQDLPASGASGQECFVCRASFHTSASPSELAARYGVCVPGAQCRGLRSALPGGLDGKDADGVELP